MEESSANQQPINGPQKTRSRKKIIIIATSLVILLIAGGVLLFANRDDKKTNDAAYRQRSNGAAQKTQPQGLFAGQYLRDCRDNQVAFTHSPVAIGQMGYFEPMGKMSDGHVTPTDHVYISPLNFNAPDNTTDVVMPADGILAEIAAMPAQYIGDRQQQTAPEDHRLVIVHNCQYVSIFIHIHQLSPAIKAVVGNLKPNEGKRPNLTLKAGDLLGKIGGNPVDWSLMDSTKTLGGFITPSLYQSESWKIHVIDPISVYSGTLREQMIAKSLRSVEPLGGKIDYDKKAALIGNWFREGTNGYQGVDQSRYWDGHLSVVPNYIDPASTMVSMGNWQGKAAQYAVKGVVNPADITVASGPVKYELIDSMYITSEGKPWNMGMNKGIKVAQQGSGAVKGTVLFQVIDGEKLRVEQFPGKTAAQVSGFTAAAQTYVR